MRDNMKDFSTVICGRVLLFFLVVNALTVLLISVVFRYTVNL